MEQPPSHQPDEAGPPAAPVPAKKPRRTWSWKKRLLIGVGILIGLGALAMGTAEYYTAKPSFCRSCHIMEPYWQSWSHDLHGAKLGVRCVDCHYAPGERHTLHAKFRGLSQATSYFSGRYGSSRPRARVSDASCLMSECHGDGKYLEAKLPIGEARTEKRFIAGVETLVNRTPTVTFVHAKHLQIEPNRQENAKKIEQTTVRLKSALPADVFAKLERLAGSVQPLSDRKQSADQLLADAKVAVSRADAAELMSLTDLQVRLEQLSGLTCAACHSFDASGKNHFAVDRQACYTCHFTNQAFNAGTGRCLTCHEPPTRQIVIHGAAATQAAGASIMNHQDILARNIDCASCHLDVIHGQGRVSERECTHCHDRGSFLVNFENRTLADVREYHHVHVAAQRAHCPDCHGATQHRLIEPTLVATSAGFLKPIIDECQHCHPNHHSEQVELLMGVGGSGVDQPMPNAMFGSRVNCRACHQKPGEDFKGDPLIEATADTCVACHEQKYSDLLKQWLQELAAYRSESEKALAQVKQRVEQRRSTSQPVPDRVNELIAHAEQNINLVKHGNGIHNRNYATRLLDISDDDLREAQQLLAK